MLRYAVLGAALSGILGGLILTAGPAQGSPICVSGGIEQPIDQDIRPTCISYPLGTLCVAPTADMDPLFYGYVNACLPAPLANP